MAIRAILWRGFVEQNRLALDLALHGVAHRATHIRVAARQWELSPLIMVKRGRGPSLVHVAIPAFGNSVLGHKLAAVRIRVAGFAILRRSRKLNLLGAGERLVAFAAGDSAMRAEQGEFRFRMVEAADVNPGSGAVAALAAKCGSISALLRHAFLEFTLVGIGVTGGARAVREMERKNLVRSPAKSRFVALRAGDGYVSPSQDEVCVLMLGNRKRRAMEVLYGVAVLAAILVGSCGKLLVMSVLMAIRACREFHLVQSVLAGRRMAFVASDSRMFSFKRIM